LNTACHLAAEEFIMAKEIKVWGQGTKGLWSFGRSIDIPDGYVEVPPGDTFLTRRIKHLAEVVYVRMRRKKRLGLSVPVGLLAPEAVVLEATQEAEGTSEGRAERAARSRGYRARKEEKRRSEVAEKVRAMLPGMPPDEAEAIVGHAYEVGSGRVGRTTKLGDDERIELAVRAHIRHCRTDYDALLASGWDRESAREQVRGVVEHVLLIWRGADPQAGIRGDGS
jgi:hypothetical protein